eukprot:355645-Chlamydomonas_euryale.AAC.26
MVDVLERGPHKQDATSVVLEARHMHATIGVLRVVHTVSPHGPGRHGSQSGGPVATPMWPPAPSYLGVGFYYYHTQVAAVCVSWERVHPGVKLLGPASKQTMMRQVH